MKGVLAYVFSLSILLPTITGIIRFKKINPSYYPLIYACIVGLISETISFFSKRNNAVVINIYFLIEMLLYYWLFYNWRFYLYRKKWFYLLIGSMSLFWFVENILLQKITTFYAYYLIAHPVILVLISVNQISYMIVNEKKTIVTNSVFIICCAIIVFYSYSAMMEIFFHFANKSQLKNKIFNIQIYMNTFFNFLLFIAVLQAPKKKFIRAKII